MNKRENVRAAVDLHCLGLTPSQPQAGATTQPQRAQPTATLDSELEQQFSQESGALADPAASGFTSEHRQGQEGPEAAGHLAPGTLSGVQFPEEPSLLSDMPESPSETALTQRCGRLRPSQFGPASLALHSQLPEADHPPSAGQQSLLCTPLPPGFALSFLQRQALHYHSSSARLCIITPSAPGFAFSFL